MTVVNPTVTTTTSTIPTNPTFAGAVNVVVEWIAGEIARSPVVLKLTGIAAAAVSAIPGDISNPVVRSSLIIGGFFLTGIVHFTGTKTTVVS